MLNKINTLLEHLFSRYTKLSSIFLFMLILSGCKDEEASGPPRGSGNFTVTNGNILLSTKIWLPSGRNEDRYPLLIIVEGSEADAKEDFEANALQLTSNGVAVLAYDKRGHFNSTGPELSPNVANSALSFRFLADDLLAIVEFVKTHQNIDASHIGIFCSSQGSWIGAIAQSQSSDIAFCINMVGSATSVGIEDYYSKLSGNDLHGNNLSNLSIPEIDALVADYQGPHGFDPISYLKTIDNPQLWIFGEMDFGNPTRQSVSILNNLIANEGKDIEIVVVPNANHDLYDIVAKLQIEVGPIIAPWLEGQIQ